MVTAMDDAVGQVVKALKETGLYNDTFILFTADVCKSILLFFFLIILYEDVL